MFIRKFSDLPEFTAGDGSTLREFFNPATEDGLELRYSLAHAETPPGVITKWHTLEHSEVYYIIDGTAKMDINDESETVSAGDCLYIPPKARQRIENTGDVPLKFLCIVDPAWTPEGEVVD